MRAVFLPAGVGFVLSNPHWEHKRNKTTKSCKLNFDFWVSAAPRFKANYGLVGSWFTTKSPRHYTDTTKKTRAVKSLRLRRGTKGRKQVYDVKIGVAGSSTRACDDVMARNMQDYSQTQSVSKPVLHTSTAIERNFTRVALSV